MSFDRNFVDELKARVKLSDVIGRKLRLIRRGREFVALSPFSNEKSPSFTINDDKGFYHCFSSGKHGDAITFLMETENLSFQEAVEKIANDLGMALPESGRMHGAADKVRQSQRALLHEVMRQAAEFFIGQLAGRAGVDARAYLERRQVPQVLRQSMGIGFAPPSRTLLCESLTAKGVAPQHLLEAGLAIKPDNGGPLYDRFRDRIMFPITDTGGKVIAFGGRAMSADAQAKYLNSPETPLFHKGSVLYNLANARRAVRASPEEPWRNSLIVAEGYMDVIALTKAGIANAVAPLGTALTETQMSLLWRISPEPILCFDGDAAGTRAALRAAERALPLLKAGQSLHFALLPEGLDPDDLISREGPAAMTEILSRTFPLAEMLWRAESNRMPLDTPERRAGLEQRVQTLVAAIADAEVRRHYQADMRQRLAHLFRPETSPSRAGRGNYAEPKPSYGGRQKFAPPVGAGPVSAELKRSQMATGGKAWNVGSRREMILIVAVLHHPALLERHIEMFSNVPIVDPGLDTLRAAIIELCAASPDLETQALRDHLITQGYGPIINRLLQAGMLSGDWFCGPGAAFTDAEAGWLQTLQRHSRENYRRQAVRDAEQALADEFSLENEEHLLALQKQLAEDMEDPLDAGFGEASGRIVKH